MNWRDFNKIMGIDAAAIRAAARDHRQLSLPEQIRKVDEQLNPEGDRTKSLGIGFFFGISFGG